MHNRNSSQQKSTLYRGALINPTTFKMPHAMIIENKTHQRGSVFDYKNNTSIKEIRSNKKLLK